MEKTALREDMIAVQEELDVTKRCSFGSVAMPTELLSLHFSPLLLQATQRMY